MQMVDANAFYALASVDRRVDHGMDVHARRRIQAASTLGVLPDLPAVGTSVHGRKSKVKSRQSLVISYPAGATTSSECECSPNASMSPTSTMLIR